MDGRRSYYNKLHNQIQQNEAAIRSKKDQINSQSLNKIKDYLQQTQNQQYNDYMTPKIESARENMNIIDQKYYNQGLNIANMKQRPKWELP